MAEGSGAPEQEVTNKNVGSGNSQVIKDKAVEQIPSEATQLNPDRIKAYLTELSLQATLAKKQVLEASKLQQMVDESIAAGIPRNQMITVLESAGIKIKQKTEEDTAQSETQNKDVGDQLEGQEWKTVPGAVTGHDLNLLQGLFNGLRDRATFEQNVGEGDLLRGLNVSIFYTPELWGNPKSLGEGIAMEYRRVESVLENLRNKHESVDLARYSGGARALPSEQVSVPKFRAIENRVEAARVESRKLHGEYGEDPQKVYTRAVQTLEQDAAQHKNGRTETVLDARGYTAERFRKIYTLSNGASVTEETVAFVRQSSGGQREWLTDANKSTVMVNADSYDARIPSIRKPQSASTLVKHNEFGQISGIVTVLT